MVFNIKSLAEAFGMDRRTLSKIYKQNQKEIGMYVARRWNHNQVNKFKELLGGFTPEFIAKHKLPE